MRETGAGTSEMVSRGGATASLSRLATGRLKWRRQALRLQPRRARGSSVRVAAAKPVEIGLAIALCLSVRRKVGEVNDFGVCADIEFRPEQHQRRSSLPASERSGGLRFRLVQRRCYNRIRSIDLHVNHRLAAIGFVSGNCPYTNTGQRGDAGNRCSAQGRRARSKQARQK
jgi:hypothetical protein